MTSTKMTWLRHLFQQNCVQSFNHHKTLASEWYRQPFSHLARKLLLRSSSSSTILEPERDINQIMMKCGTDKTKMINEKRSYMFTKEQNRQRDLIPRVQKIQVQYKGTPEDTLLLLNKGLSTPFDVAQHISEVLVEQSALALVNGEVWDMGRPLEEDCTVELMHFHMNDPFHVNRAFWRSCSFSSGDK